MEEIKMTKNQKHNTTNNTLMCKGKTQWAKWTWTLPLDSHLYHEYQAPESVPGHEAWRLLLIWSSSLLPHPWHAPLQFSFTTSQGTFLELKPAQYGNHSHNANHIMCPIIGKGLLTMHGFSMTEDMIFTL